MSNATSASRSQDAVQCFQPTEYAHQDEASAALLENLANFEPPESFSPDRGGHPHDNGATLSDLENSPTNLKYKMSKSRMSPTAFDARDPNDNFASLLQAVATAGNNEEAEEREQIHMGGTQGHGLPVNGNHPAESEGQGYNMGDLHTQPARGFADSHVRETPAHVNEQFPQGVESSHPLQDQVMPSRELPDVEMFSVSSPTPSDSQPGSRQSSPDKRKRQASSPAEDSLVQAGPLPIAKRRKGTAALRTYEERTFNSETEPRSDAVQQRQQSEFVFAYGSGSMGDTHTPTPALARKLKPATSKHARPPVAATFQSLQISIDQYQDLNFAAKDYLLDPEHPERDECVGRKDKDKRSVEDTKMKLFQTMAGFLDDQPVGLGWGERCFGASAVGAEGRRLKWPEMRGRIVHALQPVFKRILINERQRKYAIDSRTKKQAAKDQTIEGQLENLKKGRKTNLRFTPEPRRALSSPTPEPSELPSPQRTIQERASPQSRAQDVNSMPTPATPQKGATSSAALTNTTTSPQTSAKPPTIYYLNLLRDGVRIRPKIALNPSTCPNFASLVRHIADLIGDDELRMKRIQILTGLGMRSIENEQDWLMTVIGIKNSDWMDSEVRICVSTEGH